MARSYDEARDLLCIAYLQSGNVILNVGDAFDKGFDAGFRYAVMECEAVKDLFRIVTSDWSPTAHLKALGWCYIGDYN